jgi:hypothetical protein
MIGFIGTIRITISYDSSQSMTVYDSLHSLLDHERLLFHCDEWWTANHSHIELFTTESMRFFYNFQEARI